MSGVTWQLARFIVDSQWEHIPQTIRHEGKRALLNRLGCALGGSHELIVDNTVFRRRGAGE